MVFALIILSCFISAVHAEEISPEGIEAAIAGTQSVLSNPGSRKKAMNENNATKAADKQVRALGGTEKQNQEVYELAADIFGSLARDAKGNPDEMEKALQKGLSDPEGFANKLTPEQRKKLRRLSIEMEKSKSLP